MSNLAGWKTYIVSVACLLAALLLYAFGGEAWHGAATSLLGMSGLGVTLRQALAKIEKGLGEWEPVPEADEADGLAE